MLRYSFSLTGREIEKLLKKGFKFKNYALLTKNSTFLKYKVTNIEMSHFLNTNKEHIFTKEIQQETSLLSVHIQKIVQQCEQLIVEYCLTTHRCQLIFVAKDSFDTALTSFNQ